MIRCWCATTSTSTTQLTGSALESPLTVPKYRDVTRRQFLATLANSPIAAASLMAPLAIVPLLASCDGAPPNKSAGLIGLSRKTDRVIAGAFVDDDSNTGHQLRDGVAFAGAREQRNAAVAIVGGGIGGLSAGWRLDKLGVRDWLLLELGRDVGGNARGGENEVSRYPWGAHYVPIPGKDATHVRELFLEMGVLDANGTWDERTLCHSPQERLWQHGRWHEGVEPFDALPRGQREQFAKFDATIDEWRASGAFQVPMGNVHMEQLNRALQQKLAVLDAQTAEGWMATQGFTSPALRWWVEYGTRDDYGASLKQASAWAAVHYFAARDAEEQGPLTWPEGNHHIVKYLSKGGGNRIVTDAPAYRVQKQGNKWLVRTPKLDVLCEAVIWAAPLLVLPKVVEDVRIPVATDYAPWVVANITLDHWPSERGAPPSWDNVIYDSQSLGYVVATHQNLGQSDSRTVWTWYHAVVDRESAAARTWLRDTSWSWWRDHILADLARAHPDIADAVTRIDVRRWGHAMARPVPGALHRMAELRAWNPAPQMFVAHADMSGFSLFEEAQWWGVAAADAAARLVAG
jgi:phytoene dehydrogenase-like protein